MNNILVHTSPGELLDKLSILKIKQAEIKDKEKLKNVATEMELLNGTVEEFKLLTDHSIVELFDSLLSTNQKLWKIEDDIRDKEKAKTFDNEFIKLARSVYFTNDVRADLKKKINLQLGSVIVEEKSYSEYK